LYQNHIVMDILILISSLVIIILSANALVSGASSIAKRFKIPDLVIGLTIVAIGTSTPELVICVISALKGNTDIAVGNILGSNIANILLILGLSAIIFPLSIQKNTQFKEIPLGVIAIVLIAIAGNDILIDHNTTNVLSRMDGMVMLCFFLIFLYYTFQITSDADVDSINTKEKSIWISAFFITLGIAGLYLGGKYFVDSAVAIARYLGMSEATIGLTIVAIGTSLPELATSLTAAYKKNPDIAVGNIIGSNILNVFLILGITATITPLPLSPTANIDIAVAFVASVLLFLSTFFITKRKITRIEGFIFFFIYMAYITYLVFIQ
jgi:cation:H+ antiporter